MKKRILSLFIALVAAVVLVGCGKKTTTEAPLDLTGTYQFKVWVADAVKELTETQIAAFNESEEAKSRGIKVEATVEAVGEGDAATKMISDVQNGADLFGFAQDQLARLVESKGVSALGNAAAKFVKDNNDGGAASAATLDGKLYAYPMTSDNGYFMYYNKSVITDETHLKSLEDLIADCEAQNYMFSFELEGSGWYNAAFFFATGCVSSFTFESNGAIKTVNDTYNSEAGVVAMKGMQKLLTSKAYNNSSNAAASFSATTPSAVVVSGTWDSAKAKEALGDNFGVAELPSFTVDGKSYHLSSFTGNKLMGIRPQSDPKRAAVLNILAQYLTGAVCQEQRFDQQGWGPSNKTVQAMDKIANDEVLAAFNAQNNYGVAQGQYPGQWWDLTKVLATSAKNAKSDAELQTALKEYKDTLDSLVGVVPPSWDNGPWTVIGDINEDTWTQDIAMTKKESATEGQFVFETAALELKAGNEFKCRLAKNWDDAVGVDGQNYKVEADGTYIIRLTVTDASKKTATIELVPVE